MSGISRIVDAERTEIGCGVHHEARAQAWTIQRKFWPDAARYITHETPIVSEQSLLRPALDVVVDDLLRAAVREFDSKLLTIKCGDDAIAELLVRHAVTDSVARGG